METSDLLKSGLGALIGFALAQLVNLAALVWKRWRRPKLKIKQIKNALLLSHTTQLSPTEDADELYFGFVVQNVGRTVSTGVRFQIIGIKFGHKNGDFLDYLGEMALDLSVYRGAHGTETGASEITLVPNAAARIALAWWREDQTALRPCVDNSFDYYDEMADNVTEFEFDIAAFDDSGNLATSTIRVDTTYAKTLRG